MKKLTLLAVALVMSLGVFAQDVTFSAEKSQLKWTGKKVVGEHWGYINLKSGAITLKDNKITTGKFVIDMASITVKDLEAGEWNDKLVGHLKNDDFFAVDKFKEAVLVITESSVFKGKESTVTGKLTIKDQTHPITFKAIQTADGYTAKIAVDRTKYDIKYGSGKFFSSLGDNMIEDEFILDVKLVK